jgi:3-methyladenine DNA glycosylase AlkD
MRLLNRKATDKFHSALREWGRKAFNWSIIDECNNYTKLSKLEKEYIKRYDAIDNGYNTQIRFDANAINRINETNYVNNFLKRVQ